MKFFNSKKEILECLFGFLIFMAIVVAMIFTMNTLYDHMLALTINEETASNYDIEEETLNSYQLYYLNNQKEYVENAESHGGIILGIGGYSYSSSNKNEIQYYWLQDSDKGIITCNTIEAPIVKIISDDETPHIDTIKRYYKKKGKNKVIKEETYKVMYLPQSSIQDEYFDYNSSLNE